MKLDTASRKRLKSERNLAIANMKRLATDDTTAGRTEWEVSLAVAERAEQRLKASKSPRITVREPDVYGRKSGHDFALDIAAASSGMPVRSADPTSAQRRLYAYAQHDAPKAQKRAARRAIASANTGGYILSQDGNPISERALSTASTSIGSTFAPVFWDEAAWIKAIKAGSVFANLIKPLPLVGGITEIILPAVGTIPGQTSTDVGAITAENAQPNGTVATSGFVAVPIRSYAGVVALSQQLVDRAPNLSELLLSDAARGAAEQLDIDLLTGDGTGNGLSGNILGILNTGLGTITYTAAPGTAAGRLAAIGEGASKVVSTRKRSPEVVLLNDAQWWSDALSTDSSGTTFVRVGDGFKAPKLKPGVPVGPLAGLPVYLSPAVPADLGTGTNQYGAVLTRPSDQRLWISPPSFSFLSQGYGANALTALWEYHFYVCAAVGRFDGAESCIVTGTGFIGA